jgi:spore maturation protein CgeB
VTPWSDCEALFRGGLDYLTAATPDAMLTAMATLDADPARRKELADSGLETIRARHSCAHRADELLTIVRQVAGRQEVVA